jgi:hypothetical protein
MKGTNRLSFFFILFFCGLFVIFFLKRISYKQIVDINTGKVVMTLPSSVNVKPEKNRLIIKYLT